MMWLLYAYFWTPTNKNFQDEGDFQMVGRNKEKLQMTPYYTLYIEFKLSPSLVHVEVLFLGVDSLGGVDFIQMYTRNITNYALYLS